MTQPTIPFVKIRSNDESVFTLDAVSTQASFNPNDSFITNIDGNNSKSLTKNPTKFAATFFTYSNTIENVNEKNDTIEFTYALGGVGPGVQFTVTIPTGRYGNDIDSTGGTVQNGRTNLLEQIIIAMDAATAVNTFEFIGDTHQGGGPGPAGPLTVNALRGFIVMGVTDPAGTFFFGHTGSPYSPFMRKQRFLWNPQLEPQDINTGIITGVLASSKIYGPVNLIYTRYFDIKSFQMSQDNIIPNYTTDDGPSDVLLRVYRTVSPNQIYGSTISFEVNNPRFAHINPQRTLTDIDIRILDEYNEELALPPTNGDFQGSNFHWSMELLLEM